jgi:enamine deaminase RidA (YjgF/YER057c/UK114 family)
MFHDQGLLMTTDSPQLPVSTGVSGRNHRKAWCTLDLLAIRPLAGKEIEFERLYNPRQNEAPEYGSAFSRGLSVATGRCRYLLVSGTAAIDANGLSTHTGDFRRQVEETLGTVIELLLTAGSSQHHIVQATAFIKPGSDVGELRRILESQGFAGLPIVFVNGDICREELLFELDATALMPATGWTRDG